MGAIKDYQFSQELIQFSEKFNALGHTGRLAIYFELHLKESLDLKEMVQIMQLSPNAVYTHIRKMTRCGLLSEKTDGNKQIFSLNKIQPTDPIETVESKLLVENIINKITFKSKKLLVIPRRNELNT